MKKTIIRILSLLLLTVLCTVSFSGCANTDEVQGTFSFLNLSNEEMTGQFRFRKSWFAQSSFVDNPGLLKVSLYAALSTSENRGDTFSKKYLGDLGFSDLISYDTDIEPRVDTVGTVFGRLRTDGVDVIAVIVRGDKYFSEWAGNFIVGSEGNAHGLDNAARTVRERLLSYLDSLGPGPFKIWITGYSRGGAVSDLLGAYITKDPRPFHTKSEDVFVYTFEAPAASAERQGLSNIKNISQPTDPILIFCPSSWGLGTNGLSIRVGNDPLIDLYDESSAKPFSSMPASLFLEEFSAFLGQTITRDAYADHYESSLVPLILMIFSKPDTEKLQILDLIKLFVFNVIPDTRFIEQVKTLWEKVETSSDPEAPEALSSLLYERFEKYLGQKTDPVLTADDWEIIRTHLPQMIRFLGTLISADRNSDSGVHPLWHFRTFLNNVDIFASTHTLDNTLQVITAEFQKKGKR